MFFLRLNKVVPAGKHICSQQKYWLQTNVVENEEDF